MSGEIQTFKPWENEPDRIDGTDDFTGYQMLIRRHPGMGHLCGYVGVVDHPCFAEEYDFHLLDNIDVHGGLTYDGVIQNEGPFWWFGFDCSHYGDLMPYMNKGLVNFGPDGDCSVYRDIEFVKAECANLAKQLYLLDGKAINITKQLTYRR